MSIPYATVKAKGQIVIPACLRRKFGIEEGTRVAFLEERGRLFFQPVTDMFIDSVKGMLTGHRFPDRIERDEDRRLE
jgi:AbrB family looped-hinge helix DNA binding protein